MYNRKNERFEIYINLKKLSFINFKNMILGFINYKTTDIKETVYNLKY